MKIVLILWSALGLSAGVFAASYDSFRPGAEWLDTDGNPIQAHGGSIITVGDQSAHLRLTKPLVKMNSLSLLAITRSHRRMSRAVPISINE